MLTQVRLYLSATLRQAVTDPSHAAAECTQESPIIGNTEEILLTQEKSKVEQVKMDCEGFQDLRRWCGRPTATSIQTPAIIDKYGLNYYHDSFEGSKVEESSGYCFEDWFPSVDVSTEQIPPAESQISMGFENQTMNIAENTKNTTTDIYNNSENANTFKCETFVFEDAPAYEEIIDISYSNSLDGTKMEECVTVSETVLPEEISACWNDQAAWSPIDMKNNMRGDDCANCALKLTENIIFSSDAISPAKFSSPENTSNMYFDNALNNVYEENQDINGVGLLPSYEKTHNFGITLSSLKVKQNNDTIIDTIIIDDGPHKNKFFDRPITENIEANRGTRKLKLKIKMDKQTGSLAVQNPWVDDPVVTTPDVLRTIEQLETDNTYRLMSLENDNTYNESSALCFSNVSNHSDKRLIGTESYDLTPPDTPKFNLKKRRHDSEESDESYVPRAERRTPPKRTKRNNNSPSQRQNTILAKELLYRLNTPAKRGRPPKRRDSVSSSSTCNIDDNSSVVSYEDKYRERRDKNNEASRRSRFQRKMKDNETLHVADDLESRNAKLRSQAESLERKTKILKEALFAAMLSTNK